MKNHRTTIFALFFCLPGSLLADTIFVNTDAIGANNGSSWTDAYRDLQDALAGASFGDEIWVAEGAYYPDEGTNQTANDRDSTFHLKNELALYGGFSGTESSLSQRDPSSNETILSGDLNQDDGPDLSNNSENAYHVLTGSDTDSTAVLSGFTIEGGNANFGGSSSTTRDGGGLYNDEGSPSLSNCSFQNNSAIGNGGAIYNFSESSPSLINCFFVANSAGSGGAVSNSSASSPSFINCSLPR